MSIESDGSVRHQVVVDLDVTAAFDAFARIDRVKPRDHTLLDVAIEESVLEPWAGGAVYDRGVDGSVCRWGRVLAFDPPYRLAFSWDIGPDWQVVDDPERCSEVEVTFTPVSPTRTEVVLEHRALERHGASWESLREGVDGSNGWPRYLAALAAVAGQEPASS